MTVVAGAFDHIRLHAVRHLHEASKVGPVELRLTPRGELPYEERRYMWEACRYVARVGPANGSEVGFEAPEELLSEIPPFDTEAEPPPTGRPKVIVTGCFDWLHSGHVRFFEEVSAFGELTVVVGSDRNVSLLKGPRHPLFGEDERRYLVASIRSVHRCLVSTGEGWMDAAPEIERLRPDIYIVNEDGDKPEKREFCAAHGLEYKVLARKPAPGLPKRESTVLRGF